MVKLMVATEVSDKSVFCFLQTFLTLSLQDMASRVQLSGPQEAEKYVLHMVSWFCLFFLSLDLKIITRSILIMS